MKIVKLGFNIGSWLILFIGISGLIIFLWVLSTFGNIEWEQILLNLAQPMTGVAVGLVVSGILLIGFVGIVSTLLTAFLIRRIMKKYAPIGYILAGILAAAYPLHRWHLVDFVLSRFVIGHLYETEHEVPDIQTNGRNLIFIILESYEKSFQNKAVFGQNLLPGLTQIEAENDSISGFRQLRQTSWTITSLMSSFCGVPLKLNNMFVDLSLYQTFIPGLSCWPEQMSQQGYETVLMKAASVQFTGTDRFATQHGFQKAVGFRELKHKYGEKNLSQWGLNDEVFYQAVRDELQRLGNQKRPFLFATVQADTHQPFGYVSPACSAVYHDYRDAVLCSDAKATELIRWIQEQPFYENTTIVVMGDHLVSATNIDNLIEKLPQREIYFTVIHPANNKKMQSHLFTNLDIAPTVLDALGFDFSGRFGLGRSLYRAEKTLIETKENRLEYELDCVSQKYKSWNLNELISFYDAPENLNPLPFGQSIAIPDGLNKYFAMHDVLELAPNQFWTRENQAVIKLKTDAPAGTSVDLTLQTVIPGSSKKSKHISVLSGNTVLMKKIYHQYALATEVIHVPAEEIKNGIIELSIRIETDATSKTYDGIQFLSFQLDEAP